MIELSPKLTQALKNSRVTSLIPLIRIYKDLTINDPVLNDSSADTYSIKETTIKNLSDQYENYKPLLLNSPSISTKADIIDNKYTISSVTLTFSDLQYKGKILSHDIKNYVGKIVQIYYTANGIDSLEDSVLVYTGTPMRYTQANDSVSLVIEDLTEQKLKTKIPSTLIEDSETYQEEDIGKPFPMVYGYVDRSPLILDKFDSLSCDKPDTEIFGVWDKISNIDFLNTSITNEHWLRQLWLDKKSSLSIYNDGYVSITEQMPYQFGTKDRGYGDSDIYNFENQKFNFDNSTFVYERYTEEDGENIGQDKIGIPTRIYRPVENLSFYARNIAGSYYAEEDGDGAWDYEITPASNNRFYGFSGTPLHDAAQRVERGFYQSGGSQQSETLDDFVNDSSVVREKYEDNWENGDETWWEPTELNASSGVEIEDGIFDDIDENHISVGRDGKFPVEWIQDGIATQSNRGLHISAQNRQRAVGSGCYARLFLKQNIADFPCVTKLFYFMDYFTATNISNNTEAEPVAFWIDKNLIARNENDNQRFGEMDSDRNNWQKNYDEEDWYTDCEVPNAQHAENFNTNESQFRYTRTNVSNYDYNNIIINFNSTNAYDSIQWGMPIVKGGNSDKISTCFANLKEFYTLQDVLITDYKKQKFFGTIVGRTEDDEVLSKPHTILDNILKEELDYTQGVQMPDETLDDDWIHSFTLNEQQETKQVINNLFKSSVYTPSYDTNGKFKFLYYKRNIDATETFETIKHEDVISYSFSLTKIEDVVNQVNVKYSKDYGSGDYEKETGFGITDNLGNSLDTLDLVTQTLTPDMLYDINYYGIELQDAKLEVETDYIRDDDTARKLQRKLLMWYANQHLIVKLKLPATYISTEVGDYLKFDELIENKLAFGENYTTEYIKNGQLIYPVFFVSEVSKSIDGVSLTLIQQHRGDFGSSDDQLDVYDIPNPYENNIYEPEEVVVEPFFNGVWYNNNNNLLNEITAITDTNFETDIQYELKLRESTEIFEFDGISIPAFPLTSPNFINADTLVDSEVLETDSLNGDNIRILPKINKDNIIVDEEVDRIDLVFELIVTANNGLNYSLFFTQTIFLQQAIGDLNNDGIVNILDVVQLTQIVLNDGDYNSAGDMNDDGGNNILDIVSLVNLILGGGN